MLPRISYEQWRYVFTNITVGDDIILLAKLSVHNQGITTYPRRKPWHCYNTWFSIRDSLNLGYHLQILSELCRPTQIVYAPLLLKLIYVCLRQSWIFTHTWTRAFQTWFKNTADLLAIPTRVKTGLLASSSGVPTSVSARLVCAFTSFMSTYRVDLVFQLK